MKRKTRMSAGQFARWQDLNARTGLDPKDPRHLSYAEWDEWRDLRDNHVLPPQTPEPGTPATFSIGSDRYAMEVIRSAPNGLNVWARRAGSKDEEGERFTYRPTTGRYLSMGGRCGSLYIGHAEDYTDPSY